MCKVSVIMPVYNKEKYVERAIQSVLNQTYKMLELIIINDGSTDNSLIKCKRFEDERIIIIDSENYGVSHARNLGIARATGTFITFLDADDYLDVYYLEQLLDEKSQMVISGLCAVQENLVIIEKCVPDREGIVWLKEILPSFYQEQYKTGIYGFVAGKLIKTSIIQENKIYFNENIRLAEDYDFF